MGNAEWVAGLLAPGRTRRMYLSCVQREGGKASRNHRLLFCRKIRLLTYGTGSFLVGEERPGKEGHWAVTSGIVVPFMAHRVSGTWRKLTSALINAWEEPACDLKLSTWVAVESGIACMKVVLVTTTLHPCADWDVSLLVALTV